MISRARMLQVMRARPTRSAMAIGLCFALAGCPRLFVRERIPAQCDPIGFQVCKSQAKWEGDPESADAWDNLGDDTLAASRAETRTCEVRRKALEQCLLRLEKQRVIDLGKP